MREVEVSIEFEVGSSKLEVVGMLDTGCLMLASRVSFPDLPAGP